MLPPLLLAAALASSPAAPASSPSPPPLVLHQEDDWEEHGGQEERPPPRLLLSAWGGEGFLAGGSGAGIGLLSAEVAWAFRSVDVGISGTAYRNVPADDVVHPVTPVVLLRLTQRFHTRRGFDAAFSLGFGAGRLASWHGWYQVAMGLRVPLGPLFLGGELAFEQLDILRLSAGIGVGF